MNQFSANHFSAKHFALAHLRGVLEQVAIKKGGDDAFHEHKHVGWDKKAWKKKQEREELFAKTISSTYEQIMGIAPNVDVVKEVASKAVAEKPQIIQVPYANYDGLEEWLQSQQELVRQIIQRRIEEDEEELMLLLL